MENAEWRQLVREINLDIRGIIRGQRTLHEVNEELRGRKARPIEEDFIHSKNSCEHARTRARRTFPAIRQSADRGTPSDRRGSRRTFPPARRKRFLMTLIHAPPLSLGPVCRMKIFSGHSRVA